MTIRKKKILLIQITIFIFATLLIYFTYYNRDNVVKKVRTSDLKTKGNVAKDNLNTFEDVEYKGIDLNGNRYEIKSEVASFDNNTPELVDMEVMKGFFYFKDGTVLTVIGDYGKYNNKTMDIKFESNVVAKYVDNTLYADNLNYINTENMLTIYGNVKTESVKGNIAADKLEFDLSNQTLDASMFSEEQIKVKVRK